MQALSTDAPRAHASCSRALSPRFGAAWVASLALSLAGACVVGDAADNDIDPGRADTTPSGPKPGYYDAVDPSTPETLRRTVHEAINDHTWFPYTSTKTDTWDMLEEAHEDPADSTRVIDIYRNDSYPKWHAGNDDYDREHTWPKSLGFSQDLKYNYPYTDGHHLMIANHNYNAERGNKPYGNCVQPCSEWVTVANGAHGGSTPEDPGTSNWTKGFNLDGVWEVWRGRRGDVARAMFYMDVRYEGGVHGVTGRMEPDLILTDDLTLIVSDTTKNLTVGYMGHLSTLLEWHREDPVSEDERRHNNVIEAYQGNRNPFVDHPEWVACVFEGECGNTPPPAAVWINELHYDNAGTDTDEGVELAGSAGTNLTGFALVLYNGSTGAMYQTVTLDGVLPDEGAGLGALWISIPGMQNGAPDGVALIDKDGAVVQLLSYEGRLGATDGPAMGMVLEDIGVAESATTVTGTSLQLTGPGCGYADFAWSAGVDRSPGALNQGQTPDC